jgi:hypothetical protein
MQAHQISREDEMSTMAAGPAIDAAAWPPRQEPLLYHDLMSPPKCWKSARKCEASRNGW